MASSVPATKIALKALLEAWTWPAFTPDIRWGGPTNMEDYSQGGEMIYFAEVRDYADNANTLGATRLDETFLVRLHIDVVHGGDDEQETDQRAWDLLAEVRRLCHQNRNLVQSPGVMTVHLGDRTASQVNVPLPEQWLVRIVLDQQCTGYVFNP